MRMLPALIAAVMLTATPALAEGTVLTVSGAVEKADRGPLDAFGDAFLNFHGHGFEAARAFARSDLAGLPQVTITANAEGWPGAVELEGPLLADVLEAAGATGRPITVYALDGYGASMSPEDIAAVAWVLAISADGEPLGIGGRGPAWLAYDTGEGVATAEEEGAWVWSVFHIAVE